MAATESQSLDTNISHAASILSQHRGRENAIPGDELAKKIGVSHSTVRNFIPDIIGRYGLPVANCHAGYYVITDVEEFREIMDAHQSRRESLAQRMRALSRAWYGTEVVRW